MVLRPLFIKMEVLVHLQSLVQLLLQAVGVEVIEVKEFLEDREAVGAEAVEVLRQ
jgi:hypothetical protein